MPRKDAKGARGAGETVALRVVVVGPPPGVTFSVQGRIGEHFGTVRSKHEDLVFDVVVRAVAGDPPRFLGPVAQGPPAKRFLYVCSGTCAGDASSPWTRRAKIPFATITSEIVGRALRGGRLVARIAGRAKDGGPACATVPLLDGRWTWSE